MQPIFFVIGVAVLCEAVAAGHRNESAAHSCSNGTVCHGLEKHCWESGVSRCEVLAKVTSDGASGVLVDLMSHANGEKLHLNFTNRWIGLGFSLSGKMPNAAVVHCFNDDNNTVQAKLTFNVPDRHFNTGWKDIDQSPLEVQVAKLENDELHCVVKLHKIFKIKESTFDLNKPHKLLVATGPLKNGTISRHDRMPAISDKEASF